MFTATVVLALSFGVPIQAHGAVHSGGKPLSGAVVSLHGSKKAKPGKKVVVSQRNKQFSPRVTVVTVGTQIDFPNNDTVFHNVFAHRETTRFDLGMYPKGSKKTHTFDKPGVVSLLCSIHPDMAAFVVVLDTPHYARSGKDGSFSISEIEPGAYRARVWHESGKKHEVAVQVAAGRPIRLDVP